MKWAAIGMAGLAVVLGALAWNRGGSALFVDGLRASGRSGARLLPLLAVVFLLAGFAEVLLPRELVARWLSERSGIRGLVIAMILGALTPGGGPVGLPLAATLMRQGAGIGVLVTYLTSMSLLSFVRIPLELGTYGARLTALRVASSLPLPFLAGWIAQWMARFSPR